MSNYNSIFNANSYFAQNPVSANLPRSTFKSPYLWLGTGDSGELIPFYWKEIYPGDHISAGTSFTIRGTTPIVPVMDNAVIDFYYFFVPNRLIWDKWVNFMGQTDKPWDDETTEYAVPGLTGISATTYGENSLATCFGIPINTKIDWINALPFGAYAKVWNDWFRDVNLQYACECEYENEVDLVDVDQNKEIIDSDSYIKNIRLGIERAPVSKLPDYFTTCLPNSQRGAPIALSLGEFDDVAIDTNVVASGFSPQTFNQVRVISPWGSVPQVGHHALVVTNAGGDEGVQPFVRQGTNTSTPGTGTDKILQNWFAKTSELVAGAISINELRFAVQAQKYLEKNARGGNRYISIIKAHFDVNSPDARVQRAEYLAGMRRDVNINQVLQTAPSSTDSVGTTGAYSLTNGLSTSAEHLDHTFVEHGFVLGVMCIRNNQTYSYGINKSFLRKEVFDYYWPVFSCIGEQPVLNKEIYATGTATDDEVFGYNEAWADLRYSINLATGYFSPKSSTSLDYWTYASRFASLPTLSNEFIKVDKNDIQKTLALQNYPQYIINVMVDEKITREMPLYSIPGFVDHF